MGVNTIATITSASPSGTDRLRRWLWWSAIANLVVNIGIVVTGGVVRLTGSGLGCPTWPRCTEDSYVAHGELGINGVIEFGNRLLTFVLVLVSVTCWVLALLVARRVDAGTPRRRRAFWLATVIAIGIPAQAVVGGITVLTDLNPYVVALHLLVSMAIVCVCVGLLDELRGPIRERTTGASGRLPVAIFVVGWAALWLGTVVTGSGPHSGDLDSVRTGLDPQVVSRVHALSVWLLVALTLALLWAARRAGATVVARAGVVLLGVELVQGAIGYVQYFTGLPVVLVGLHMLGAALTAAALAWVLLSARARTTPSSS